MSNTPAASPLEAFSATLADLVAKTAPSVVAIESERALSSGFVWHPGLIVTANEALAEDGSHAVTLPGGDRVTATLIGRDATTDVALLRVEASILQPAAFEAPAIRPGALTLVVGSQAGAPIAAFGTVSLVGPGWRSMRGGEIDSRIELGLSLPRHAEGGVAVDAGGRAFGMAVFGPRRRVLVIPWRTVDRVAAKLETHGRIPRGYLGLGLQPVRVEQSGTALMVMSVDPAGPGAAAGIRQGDVLTGWDGHPLGRFHSLLAALGPESVGSNVLLSVRRGGEPVEIRLTIGERPRH
jgi:S1-C subfamily serine protease